MRIQLQSWKQRHILPKAVCGAMIALAMIVLPLPALADNETPVTNDQPAQSQSVTTPTADTASSAGSAAPTTLSQPASQPGAALQSNQDSTNTSSISLQGSGSSTVDTQSAAATQTTSDPKNTVKSTNNVTSAATSGDAKVTNNRDAGDATTGTAEATSTVINVANANGVTAGNFQTFNCDIRQDIQDNIVIDPTTLLPYCTNNPATNSATGTVGSGQSVQSGASLTDILNKIVLSAVSGSATVDGNRDAGNATSGDATALANIVNIANSSISAQHSFLGVINIYSNLQGNILVPQSFVDGLAGSGSITSSGATDATVNNTINASAASGNATVADNRTGGNAASGNASTSLTVMNLTGQEVVAKNSLLVFVNVMGEWRGMILPAPGSKTALLGSGLQTSASAAPTGSTGQGSGTQTNITNDISVSAQSGDAAVTNNRTGGNASTGKASAGVNLLNITNSNFVLDDWFGALFINVIGSWLGDFDIQPNTVTGSTTPPISDVQVYQFEQPTTVAAAASTAPKTRTSTTARTSQPAAVTATTDISGTSSNAGTVLGASTYNKPVSSGQTGGGIKLDFIALAAVIVALTLLTALSGVVIRRKFLA